MSTLSDSVFSLLDLVVDQTAVVIKINDNRHRLCGMNGERCESKAVYVVGRWAGKGRIVQKCCEQCYFDFCARWMAEGGDVQLGIPYSNTGVTNV